MSDTTTTKQEGTAPQEGRLPLASAARSAQKGLADRLRALLGVKAKKGTTLLNHTLDAARAALDESAEEIGTALGRIPHRLREMDQAAPELDIFNRGEHERRGYCVTLQGPYASADSPLEINAHAKPRANDQQIATMLGVTLSAMLGGLVSAQDAARYFARRWPGMAPLMAHFDNDLALKIRLDSVGETIPMPIPIPADGDGDGDGKGEGEGEGGSGRGKKSDDDGDDAKRAGRTSGKPSKRRNNGRLQEADVSAWMASFTENAESVNARTEYGCSVAVFAVRHTAKDKYTENVGPNKCAARRALAADLERRLAASLYIAPDASADYGTRSGELDEGNFARHPADRETMFFRRSAQGAARPAVGIVVDESGSMGRDNTDGPFLQRSDHAAAYAYALACALDPVADTALFGHTDGVECHLCDFPRSKTDREIRIPGWAKGDAPVGVRAYADAESMLRSATGRGENEDATALLVAADLLQQRYPDAPGYLLILLADGAPASTYSNARQLVATLAAGRELAAARARSTNLGEEAAARQGNAVACLGVVRAAIEANRRKGVEFLGIGFGGMSEKIAEVQWGDSAVCVGRDADSLILAAPRINRALDALLATAAARAAAQA